MQKNYNFWTYLLFENKYENLFDFSNAISEQFENAESWLVDLISDFVSEGFRVKEQHVTSSKSHWTSFLLFKIFKFTKPSKNNFIYGVISGPCWGQPRVNLRSFDTNRFALRFSNSYFLVVCKTNMFANLELNLLMLLATISKSSFGSSADEIIFLLNFSKWYIGKKKW